MIADGLLDTPIVPELMGPAPSPAVESRVCAQPAAGTFISAMTDAELRYGPALLPDGQRQRQLLVQAEAMLAEDFAGRALLFDSAAAEAHAPSAAVRRLAGRSLAGRCTDRVDCGISRGRHPTPQHCGLRGVWNRDGALLGGRDVIGPGYSTRGEILLQCGSARRVVRRADGLACRYQQLRPSEITFNQGCRPS